MANDLETWIITQMRHIAVGAGIEIVDTEDMRSLGEKALAKMGAEKSRAACYKDAFFKMHWTSFLVRTSLDAEPASGKA